MNKDWLAMADDRKVLIPFHELHVCYDLMLIYLDNPLL
jgi:hypothetical protein